jgi:short-subunit dehydrogenase
LRDSTKTDVVVVPADLSQPGSAERLYQQITDMGLVVTHLVNNAGVGLYGRFDQTDLAAEQAMIQLNITSLVTLTKLFGRNMAERGEGRIMHVASLLSFLPFPNYSVYSATKAFVLAFSETTAAEWSDTGVVVTTLCPGPVDTPFTTAEMLSTNAYKTNKPMAASEVARAGVKLLMTGKGKKVVGFNNWFISNLPRFTPDKLMMSIKKKLAAQQPD